MTLGLLLKSGKEKLKKAQIAEWELDAWFLLEYVTGCTRHAYLLHPEQEVTELQEQRYEELIQKRSFHIPLQYLTGSQEFMGLSFFVNEHVLIPRQDTEILVEEALRYLQDGMKVLDMCTGSGCILLSVLKLQGGLCGTGVDLSEEALGIARKNMENLGITAEFLQSDLFDRVRERYDCILSNPPYICTEELDTLMEEVRFYEPRMALDGHADGLYYYRKLVEQSPDYLTPKGMLFLEIGYQQAEAVCGMMEKDYKDIHVVKDLAGLDRVVYGSLRE